MTTSSLVKLVTTNYTVVKVWMSFKLALETTQSREAKALTRSTGPREMTPSGEMKEQT